MATSLASDDARLMPFAHGWKREILRLRTRENTENLVVIYISPTGVRVNCIEEALEEQKRLSRTSYSTSLDESNFVFTPEILYHPPFEVLKIFDFKQPRHPILGMTRAKRNSYIEKIKEGQVAPLSQNNLRKNLICMKVQTLASSSPRQNTITTQSNASSKTPNLSNQPHNLKRKKFVVVKNSNTEGPYAKRLRISKETLLAEGEYNRIRESSGGSVNGFLYKLMVYDNQAHFNSGRKMWMTKPKDETEAPIFASTHALKGLVERSSGLGTKGYTCQHNMETIDTTDFFRMPSKYRSPCTEHCWDDGHLPEQDCQHCLLMFHADCSKKWTESLMKNSRKWLPPDQLSAIPFEKTCANCATYDIERALSRELKKSSKEKINCQLKLTFENPMPPQFKKRLPNAICWLHGKIRSFPPELTSHGDYTINADQAAQYSSYKLKIQYTSEFDRFMDQPEVIVVHNNRVHFLSGDIFFRRRNIMTVNLNDSVVLTKSLKRIVFFCPLPSNGLTESGPMGLQIPTVDVSDNEGDPACDHQEEIGNVRNEDETEKDYASAEVSDYDVSDSKLDTVGGTALKIHQCSSSAEILGNATSSVTADVEMPCAAVDNDVQESLDMAEKMEIDSKTLIDVEAVDIPPEAADIDERMATDVIHQDMESDILVEVVSVGTGLKRATSDKNSVGSGKAAKVGDLLVNVDDKSSLTSGETISDGLVRTPENFDFFPESMDDESEIDIVETRDTGGSKACSHLRYRPCYKDLGEHRILDTIFSHLDTVSLLRCRLVCRDWKRTIDSSPTLCGGQFSPQSGYQLTLADVTSLFHWLVNRQVGSVDLRNMKYSSSHIEDFVRMVELYSVMWPSRNCLTEVRLKECSRKLFEQMQATMPQLQIVSDNWTDE